MISTKEMSQTDWLIERKRGIGGSDVAGILGISPYTTSYQVWKDKVSDEVNQIEENNAMHFGKVLENVIAEEYMKRNNRKVLRDNKIRIHPEKPFLIANIDRMILPLNGEGRGILEIKTASGFAFKQWQDSIPLQYYCQLQHYFSVTGLGWGEFAILVDGREFYTIPIKRDEEYINKQNEALELWWNTFVVPNIPPPLTAKEYSFVETVKKNKEVDVEILATFNELTDTRKEIAELEEKEDSLKDKIKLFMAENEILTFNDNPLVYWKTQKQNRVDTTLLKKEQPEIAMKYIKETTFRKFEIKGA